MGQFTFTEDEMAQATGQAHRDGFDNGRAFERLQQGLRTRPAETTDAFLKECECFEGFAENDVEDDEAEDDDDVYEDGFGDGVSHAVGIFTQFIETFGVKLG